MPEVLHIIDRLDMGGGTRSTLAAAKYSTIEGSYQHSIVSLRPSEESAIKLATESGVHVHHAPAPQVLHHLLTNADIVQIEYWNAPTINRFLRNNLPEMRLVIWYHIAGDGTPQIISPELASMPDLNVACNPYTYEELPVFRDLPQMDGRRNKVMALDPADFDRVRHVKRRTHKRFNVGYIGTVDFVKMHPDYIAMSAAVDIPDVQFIVCGKGIEQQLLQQAANLGAESRFTFKGYVEDIGSIISKMDVYGYPLCEGTYAAAELNLQEVMYAGIPPVVFPYGGVKRLIQDKKTGLVVKSAEEYTNAIEYLYKNPDVRKELGENAAQYAREHFGGENAAKAINPAYDELMFHAKRSHRWGEFPSDFPRFNKPSKISTAQLFTESLGHHGQAFAKSLSPVEDAELLAAEQEIAHAPYLVFGTGIRPYRIADPNDPHMRIWAGLYLENKKNYPEALQEYAEALKMSKKSWRLQWYCARTLFSLGKINEAQTIYDKLRRLKPDFNKLTGDTRCLPRSLPPSREKVRVSAIVSTYNSSSFIEGCLQDLIEQTLFKKGELEVIVIDSGSEENEKEIVQRYANRFPNIMYMRTPNRETLYKSWNRGIKLASGDYITNANTDDRHRKDAFEVMAGFLDSNNSVALVYPRQIETSEANETFATTSSRKVLEWPIYSYEELERHCIVGSQPMWRATLHEEYGLFREELKSAGDYEFWLRIGKKETFFRHPEVLGLYYRNPNGIEHSTTTGEEETIKIWEEYGMFERGVATILKGQLYRPNRKPVTAVYTNGSTKNGHVASFVNNDFNNSATDSVTAEEIDKSAEPISDSRADTSESSVMDNDQAPVSDSDILSSSKLSSEPTDPVDADDTMDDVEITSALNEDDAILSQPDSSASEAIEETDNEAEPVSSTEEISSTPADEEVLEPEAEVHQEIDLMVTDEARQHMEEPPTSDEESEESPALDLGAAIEAFQEAFVKGDMESLRMVASSAVAQHPDQPYPYILKAMMHRLSNEYEDAFDTLRRSLTVRQTDEAFRELKQLLAGEPPLELKEKINLILEGNGLSEESDHREDTPVSANTQRGSREVETEAECIPDSMLQDFSTLLGQERIFEASEIALSAIRQFPAAPEAWVLRAKSLRLNGDAREAHRAIEQSLLIEDTPEALFEMLEIKLVENEGHQAEQLASFIKRQYPDWSSRVDERMPTLEQA